MRPTRTEAGIAAAALCLLAIASAAAAAAIPTARQAALPLSLAALSVSALLNLLSLASARREAAERGAAAAERDRLLAEALERADSSDRARRAIIMNMTHEFRTPLNSVIGFAELLAEGETDPERIEMARCVQRGGWQMLDLVNSVIRAAELSSAAVRRREPVTFTPGGLLGTVAAAHARAAREKGVELRADSSDSRALVGCMDSIVSLLGLLVSNAIKYSESGGAVALRCRELPVETPHGATYEFSVADRGRGMDKAQLERLFSPFEQGEHPLVKRHGGVGVGLYSAKRLAESLSGDLTIESEVGVGTTAYLIVPLEIDREREGAAR